MTLSKRNNKGKRRIDLVPISAINAMADVLTKGAEKYDERQWEKGHKWSTPYASLMRHITAWWNGEDNDSESGLSHLYHALMNIAMLVEYEQNYPELDDRPNSNTEEAKLEKYLWCDSKEAKEFYAIDLPKDILSNQHIRVLYEYKPLQMEKKNEKTTRED